jgi:hypothetical protein
VFDVALHFRCLQKATEAYFELAQATLAASLACQTRLNDEWSDTVRSAGHDDWSAIDPSLLWQRWAQYWSLPPAPRRSPMDAWQAAWTSPAAAASALASGASNWPAVMFWNASPWTLYQGPLIAMMLTYGVPYSVAAPTARASTCAMDAADAACTQWRLLFASEDQPQTAVQWPGRSAYLH